MIDLSRYRPPRDKTPRDKTEAARRRRLRYLRANPLCAACLRVGLATPAEELDHITPLFKGGADDEENYQSLCHPCHAAKSAEERGFKAKPRIGPDGWPIEDGGDATK